MAPIKQEEQMRDKLEKRSLKPSMESWETLSHRLEAEQKTSDKSLFWWLGIAASVVGVLLVTTLYFNTDSVEQKMPRVVDTKDRVIQNNDLQTTEVSITNEKVSVEDLNSFRTDLNKNESKSTLETSFSEKTEATTHFLKKEAVAQIENTTSKESDENVAEFKKSEFTFEEQKIEEVVAQINTLKSNGNEVSDAEIENLLKKAQQEILSNKIYNETTRMVDANALLQDVEADLQQSFRSKVFEALQSSYESVKTAVAQRNN